MSLESSDELVGRGFIIQLEDFAGPIDLLLHLVKQKELPIEKISLAEVAEQYLACIESASGLDLEIAAEYLLIAAVLLSIKSSVLLNEPVELVEDEEGKLYDPHEALLNRLREAAVFKDMAENLSQYKLLDLDVYSTKPNLKEFDDAPDAWVLHDVLALGKAFRKLLKNVETDPRFNIQIESVSIVERMLGILKNLEAHQTGLDFYDLCNKPLTRVELLSSFLAILELCKRQLIHIVQEDNFSGIRVLSAGIEYAGEELKSEFDETGEQDQNTAFNA